MLPTPPGPPPIIVLPGRLPGRVPGRFPPLNPGTLGRSGTPPPPLLPPPTVADPPPPGLLGLLPPPGLLGEERPPLLLLPPLLRSSTPPLPIDPPRSPVQQAGTRVSVVSIMQQTRVMYMLVVCKVVSNLSQTKHDNIHCRPITYVSVYSWFLSMFYVQGEGWVGWWWWTKRARNLFAMLVESVCLSLVCTCSSSSEWNE